MNIEDIKHAADKDNPSRMESKTVKFKDGYLVVSIVSVHKYAKFVGDNFRDRPEYVYRGQADYKWPLESTIQRHTQKNGPSPKRLASHLGIFKKATLGRRGSNPAQPNEDNDWWALGQHYGLATPLLDWTRSSWVGLYFAYSDFQVPSRRRAVYALDLVAVGEKCVELPDQKVEVVDPKVHDNPRLLAQAGILLKLPTEQALEDWVRINFKNENRVVLAKMQMPSPRKDVEYILRDLERMNINHLTLFPDLLGATGYANAAYRVPRLVELRKSTLHS